MKKLFIAITLLALAGCEQKCRPPIETVTPLAKPTFKFYLENSGSMNGFVRQGSEFVSTIHDFASQIDNKKLADSTINYNYINARVFPYSRDTKIFVESMLSPEFRSTGNTSATDIPHMLEMILAEHGGDDISVFISDNELSPGLHSAIPFLEKMRIELTNVFSAALNRDKNLAVVVVRYLSRFRGTYYDFENNTTYLDSERPFYMTIIGSDRQLNALIEAIDFNKLAGAKPADIYCYSNISGLGEYTIIRKPLKGEFKIAACNTQITKARPSRGEFGFAMLLTSRFPSALLDDEYLIFASEFTAENNVPYSKQSGSGKYILRLEAERFAVGNVMISCRYKEPEDWYAQYATLDKDPSATFGLEYLLGGIYDAYGDKGLKYNQFSININVK